MPADAVTIELIRNALISVTGEMRSKIMRSAFSPIIYESLDFSVAFFNERVETLAQADGLPYFLCDLPNAVRAVIEDVGGVEHMRAGDVFLVNDPYRCSQHPQDVSIVKPAYYRGNLFGFTAVRVHLIDLGGKAGFASTDATEIFQEGLVIPTVHLHSEGHLNEEIVRLMAANSRMSRSTMLGDLQAQVGACIVGEARLVEVIERYGFELYRECCDALLVQGEAYARAKVREIPDGRYAADLFLDDDGVNRDEPVRIKVTLIVDESDMVVDLTGSSGPCAGPYNMNPNYTNAICRIAFKSLTSPHQPSNEGHFRPVRALVPAESVFNAQRPSPVFWGFKTAGTLVDCIRRAATQAVSEQSVAGNYGWSCGAHVFGEHPADGSFFAMVDEAGGGWGRTARRRRRGRHGHGGHSQQPRGGLRAEVPGPGGGLRASRRVGRGRECSAADSGCGARPVCWPTCAWWRTSSARSVFPGGWTAAGRRRAALSRFTSPTTVWSGCKSAPTMRCQPGRAWSISPVAVAVAATRASVRSTACWTTCVAATSRRPRRKLTTRCASIGTPARSMKRRPAHSEPATDDPTTQRT